MISISSRKAFQFHFTNGSSGIKIQIPSTGTRFYGTYGESSGTFVGYPLPLLENSNDVECDVELFEETWDKFMKARSDYNLKKLKLTAYKGQTYHKCESERDDVASSNDYYIGSYIDKKLVIKSQKDKTVTVHFDYTFPANIRDIVADFWFFLNKAIKTQKDDDYAVRRRARRQHLNETYYRDRMMSDDEMFIKSLAELSLEEQRKKILDKIPKKPNTVDSVIFG